jgi:hypothetical protein
MKFNILCIDNNKLYEKQLYDFIKTKPVDKLKSEINPYITTIETDTNNLIKDVYNNLDITYDSITFFLKTSTIYENDEYLFQMMHVSDDDIYDGKFYKIDKYQFNFLGKLLINTDDNVNGKFIIFVYKINEDNTYDFCDMTSELFYKLLYENLFKKGIMIDLDEYIPILIDNDFNIYDNEYKSLNININKIEHHDYNEENLANFKLGVITPTINEDYYNDILIKLTNNFIYKGDKAYIFSYLLENSLNLIDNLDMNTFKLLVSRDKKKDYNIPIYDKKKYIHNKFTMLKSK